MDGLEFLMDVLFLSYLLLLLTAVVEWLRSRETRYLGRWLWLPIILVFSMVGPLAFLLLGRQRGVLTAAAERWNADGEGRGTRVVAGGKDPASLGERSKRG